MYYFHMEVDNWLDIIHNNIKFFSLIIFVLMRKFMNLVLNKI